MFPYFLFQGLATTGNRCFFYIWELGGHRRYKSPLLFFAICSITPLLWCHCTIPIASLPLLGDSTVVLPHTAVTPFELLHRHWTRQTKHRCYNSDIPTA
ncbi:unnamed protein product [Urochloa humidicola]